MVHYSSTAYDLSDTLTVEGRSHALCKLHKLYLCISQVIHKLPQMQPSGVVMVQFRQVIQNQLNSANVPLFWPAASHPMVLQTTVFHTWLTTHSKYL